MVNSALVALFESLAAGEIAKTLTISMLALTSYDYVLTLEKEVLYFWRGPFTISHALFFFNRYASICLVLFDTIISVIAHPSNQFCATSINLSMILNVAAIGVIQAILITRVWFLFPGEKHVQFGLIFFFVVSLITSSIFLSLSLHSLEVVNLSAFLLHFRNAFDIAGCHANRPVAFWRVYLPSLILHTGLYIMTAYHAITNWDDWHQVNLRRRLLRDGGVFYLIVFVTVGFASAGSFFSQIPQINIPAIFSPFALSMTSIATNRIMFSLREITSRVESSLEWAPLNYTSSEWFESEKTELQPTQAMSPANDEEKAVVSGW